ncbi:MAG: glycosyltransferase, partial [Candidatus Bathyarchaeota archaeon]|nr:glycosyltransferase [Candidatus Bathyarchaeota archaeon]
SVIIPTYKEGKYISGLLSRLVKADCPPEIIVVDSGSSDETVKTAKRFTDKVYEINERGIAKARNYGAYRAKGDILVFLDADVTPPSDFAEKTLKTFQDGGVVGATCNIMPTNPRISELIFFIFYNRLIRFCASFQPHSRGEFVAVRRVAFLRVGGFDESLPCLEDHDLAFRISKLGRFVFIPDLLFRESMRRIRKLGLRNVLKMWIGNYLFFVLFGRTISKIWEPVR